MSATRLRAFREDRPSLAEEPKYWTRIPDDALEDPRLNPQTLHTFGQLLKARGRGGEKVVRITQAELARECRVDVRTVRRHLDRLESTGYIRRERDYSRGRPLGGSPFLIHLCFELRAALKLEADETPVTSGTRRTPKRTRLSGCNRTNTSASKRTRLSGPSLYGEREEEKRTTTEEKPESSSSFSASLPRPEPARPEGSANLPEPRKPESPAKAPEIAQDASARRADRIPASDSLEAVALERLVERAALAFPDDANALLPKRVAEALAAWPIRSESAAAVELAMEYARFMNGRGWVYVLKTVERWYGDGYDLDDARAEVQGAKPRPRVRSTAETHHRAEVEPTADPETERRTAELLSQKNWWRSPAPAHEKTGAGASRQTPPNAGRSSPSPRGNPNRNGCSDQEDRGDSMDRAERAGPLGDRPSP